MGVTVTRLITSGNGGHYIGTSGTETSLDMTAPHAQELYSHVISAQLTNKIVNVKLSDTASNCVIAYIYSDN